MTMIAGNACGTVVILDGHIMNTVEIAKADAIMCLDVTLQQAMASLLIIIVVPLVIVRDFLHAREHAEVRRDIEVVGKAVAVLQLELTGHVIGRVIGAYRRTLPSDGRVIVYGQSMHNRSKGRWRTRCHDND